MEKYKAVIFGYGPITHRLIEKLAPGKESILCITNSRKTLSNSIIQNLEFISPIEITKKAIYTKNAIFSWRKIPEDNLVLDWLQSHKCNFESIIHLSSASVYSEHQGPIKESNNLRSSLNPQSHKFKLEGKLNEISELKGISPSNLRISNAYGEGLEIGFISNLIQAIQSSGSITVSKNVDIQRDYIHTSDIVEGILRIMKTKDNFPVVHISTGIGISMDQLLKTFEELGYLFPNRKISEITLSQSCVLEPKILSEISDWEPISFAEGIKQTLKMSNL